ncbi:MAG: DNA mismatch repair endonuclease MutL [Clostridia bacterium]|nr:DNA mismatch repair endonuclease MutL [Clostridia bacterium]
MGRINKLDISVANLIAAGEVVDRPSSALKELIENAVDSGADKITVEIKRGGVALLRVTDNGCGMTKEDLPVAVLRHATSKIRTADDLESISTLGFRGEALAAISAVADIRILSRVSGAEDGALLEAKAGCVPFLSDVGCAIGTTVIAEDIFSNLPARQKFLKSDRTEAMSCHSVAEKLALSHPEIAFSFISDGVERFSTSGDGKRYNALYAVYGKQFCDSLIEIDGEINNIRVSGFVGNSLNNRANRGMQNFFINGRFVRSRTAQAALEEAFSSYMAEGKFPVCAMWIDLDPKSVDVNVHPAKLEVKFSNEKPVFEAVYYTVRKSLEEYTGKAQMKLRDVSFNFTASEAPISAGRPKEDIKISVFENSSSKALSSNNSFFKDEDVPPTPPVPDTEPIFAAPAREQHTTLNSPRPSDFYSSYSKFAAKPTDNEEKPVTVYPRAIEEEKTELIKAEKIEQIKYIGIVFDTYILAYRGDELLIIDKHAAHERVIYEEMMKNLKADSEPAKMLLIPIEIKLTQNELAAILDFAEDIKKSGFEFSVDGSTLLVDQIPGFLTNDTAYDLIVSLAGSLVDGEGSSAVIKRDTLFSKSLYSASCKAAMKGGVHDGEEHILWLLSELSRCEDIKVCPHGRPVVTVLSHNYLDRAFGRLL